MTDTTNNTDTVPNPFSTPQNKDHKSIIKSHVDRLFRDAARPRGQPVENPVVDGGYVSGEDPVAPQKRRAYRALLAREWFTFNGPPDAPVLPLSYGEREHLKIGGLSTIVAVYARSLDARKYDLKEHPTFFDYACGVMASEHNGYLGTKEDEQLRKRFPPRKLAGLGRGLYWEPPKQHAETMASYRRSIARLK